MPGEADLRAIQEWEKRDEERRKQFEREHEPIEHLQRPENVNDVDEHQDRKTDAVGRDRGN